MRWSLWFAAFTAMLVALMPPGDASSDGASMLSVGTSLATHLSFSVPCTLGRAGRGGACFSSYYPLMSILAAPFIALGRLVAGWASAPANFVGNAFAQVVPALAAAAVAMFTGHFALLLGATRRRAVLAGLTVVFATELATYYRSFFAEPLAAMLVCTLVWGFVQDRRSRVYVPLATAGLILAKPQLVLVGLGLGAFFALSERRRRPAIEALVGTLVGTVLYGAYNLLRFSDATDFGGPSRSLHAHQFALSKIGGAAGELLISPGRGLLIYSPIVVLGLYAAWRRRRHPLAGAALVILAAALIAYIGNPGTGFNWADRYLTPAVPLFVALAWTCAWRPARWLAPTLAVCGMIIALPTFVGSYERYYLELSAHRAAPADLVWSVRRSPLVGIWGAADRQLRDASHTDVRELVKRPSLPGAAAGSVADQRFFTVVNQWWWLTPAANVPRVIADIVALLLLALGGCALALSAGARFRPAAAVGEQEPAAGEIREAAE